MSLCGFCNCPCFPNEMGMPLNFSLPWIIIGVAMEERRGTLFRMENMRGTIAWKGKPKTYPRYCLHYTVGGWLKAQSMSPFCNKGGLGKFRETCSMQWKTMLQIGLACRPSWIWYHQNYEVVAVEDSIDVGNALGKLWVWLSDSPIVAAAQAPPPCTDVTEPDSVTS